MSEWKVKKGNTSEQDFAVYQKDGVTLVTNLGDVTAIEFNVCSVKKGAAIITLTEGAGIVVDSPSSGSVRITLEPTDTDIEPGDYWMGLQLTWSATEVYECVLYVDGIETEDFVVEQDIVNV